ncbi:hypothetical protein ACHAW5_003402 [Stephanodiscus triporus]|uniref:Uncharacterized protein n=1 Tax=Stephanodiscus triporus TaxID=2934178 RepID=A0ABD3NRQ2_9STRA
MQPRPCDDRFHTPRASASSSRSQNSNAYRVAAARDTITSARSTSSSDSEFNRTSMSFTDRGSRPAPSLAPSRYISDYTVPNQSAASFRAAAAAANMHQENDLQKIVPDLTIFSLARHGRAGEVEALLQRGFPADARDEYGNTLLMVACQNGNKKISKLSLKYGCDINVVNNGGKTALHFARRFGHMELGQYLITKGADEREST